MCKCKIVIVDDQPVVTRNIKKLLENEFDDLEIHTQNDPNYAIGIILAEKPHIVILDLMMPIRGNRLLDIILEIYRPNSILISGDPVMYLKFDYVMNKSKLNSDLPEIIRKIRSGENKGYFNNSVAYEFLTKYKAFNIIDNKRLDVILNTIEETNETNFNKILDKAGIALNLGARSLRRGIDQMIKSSAFRGPKRIKPKDFIFGLYEEYKIEKPRIEKDREYIRKRLERGC